MPEQVRLRSEIEKARQRLNTKSNEIYREALKAARTEFGRARENENSLKEMFDEQKGRALDRNLSAIQYDSLAMEVKSKSQLLQSLLQRQSEANVTAQLQGIGSSNIRIVDPAEVPRFVFKPKKRRNVALGFALSLMLGVGVAFLLEFLDRTVKSGEEVTNLRSADAGRGAHPGHDGDKTNGSGRRKKPERKPEPPDDAVDPIYAVCYEDSKSLVAEAYRSVRTSLLLSGAGEPPRTVVVSSASPGRARPPRRSTSPSPWPSWAGGCCWWTPTCAARKSTRSSLADGKKGGMSHYLAGIINFEDLLVQPQGKVPGLSFITSGPVPPDPSELISSVRFDEFVERMYREHAVDHIIFDSPPILSVTDPVILGVKSDGLILVIHGGRDRTGRPAGGEGASRQCRGPDPRRGDQQPGHDPPRLLLLLSLLPLPGPVRGAERILAPQEERSEGRRYGSQGLSRLSRALHTGPGPSGRRICPSPGGVFFVCPDNEVWETCQKSAKRPGSPMKTSWAGPTIITARSRRTRISNS